MKYITFSKLGNYGRFGNALWEAMSAYGLSKKNKAKLLLPPEWEYRKYCSLNNNFYGIRKHDIQAIENVFQYIPDFLSAYKNFNTVDIIGTFQSWKYFYEFIDEIKLLFRPRTLIEYKDNFVGIHIRRGDYVNNPNYINYQPDYYLSAIEKYFPEPDRKFIICTDDPEYARMHFKGDKFIIEDRTYIEDFIILCSVKNHIICNSSFSWCAAFLSDSKKVIRPSKIFSGKLSESHEESDFWIPEWICNDEKLDFSDVTFIIPVKYDHRDRKENLDITLNFLDKFNTNIIIGEQGGKMLMNKKYGYMNFSM